MKSTILRYSYNRNPKPGHPYTVPLSKVNKDLYLTESLHDSASMPVVRNVYFRKFESVLKYSIILVRKSHSQKPQEALNLTVTEECY
jgi:hypothetical protein